MTERASAKKTKSETPLVDEMIDKSAKEMAGKEWPNLRDTPITEKDVREVQEVLTRKENKEGENGD